MRSRVAQSSYCEFVLEMKDGVPPNLDIHIYKRQIQQVKAQRKQAKHQEKSMPHGKKSQTVYNERVNARMQGTDRQPTTAGARAHKIIQSLLSSLWLWEPI